MSPRFDAYHTWLGIPADEQPPNYYRLLGIPVFESDPNVIQNARDQRMMHLKVFAAGRHTALSQRLLNEVSKAGVCLLKPTEKLAYDAELRVALGAGGQNAQEPPVVHAHPVASGKLDFPAPASEPELPQPLDFLDTMAAPSATMRVRRGKGKNKRRQMPIAILIVQWMLTGVIGLAAACFILFLVNPKHPLIVSIASTFHPEEVAKKGAVQEPAKRSRDAPPDPASDPPPDPASDPPPDPAPDPPPDKEKEPGEGGEIPPSLQRPDPSHEAPIQVEKVPSTTLSNRIALDLTKRSMVERLVDVTGHGVTGHGVTGHGKAQVLVKDVTGLNTSYDLQPTDGVVSLGEPVNVVLTQYEGVRIRLSLLMRKGGAVLNVVPEIDIGRNKPIEFTQQRVKRAYADLMKDARKLNQQLSAAKTEAVTIENWLRAPVPKPLLLRGQKAKQLVALKNSIIPALEQQMSYARDRAEVLQRLLQLAEQIHGKAEIRYVVRLETEDRSP